MHRRLPERTALLALLDLLRETAGVNALLGQRDQLLRGHGPTTACRAAAARGGMVWPKNRPWFRPGDAA